VAQVQILYWHGVPLQVRARDGDGRVSKPLSPRFQDAVDKIAVAVGLIGDDDYTAGFQWSDSQEREGTAEEAAAAVAAELESRHTRIDWRAIAESMGAQNP
jgi:hypothetical protein